MIEERDFIIPLAKIYTRREIESGDQRNRNEQDQPSVMYPSFCLLKSTCAMHDQTHAIFVLETCSRARHQLPQGSPKSSPVAVTLQLHAISSVLWFVGYLSDTAGDYGTYTMPTPTPALIFPISFYFTHRCLLDHPIRLLSTC